MDKTMRPNPTPHKGNVLIINTGSTTTKLGYFSNGERISYTNLEHSADVLSSYPSIMDQSEMRREAIKEFMTAKGIPLENVDIVMARGGLITPVVTGVYFVNQDMRDVLNSSREGEHASNLSAILADDIAKEINESRRAKGLQPRYGDTVAYIADPPMADELLPECRLTGRPEFPRKALFHALNSRAIVRRYVRERGHAVNDMTLVVAHMGGGATISLHRNGRVVDTSHALGGDGPITPERAGFCPPFDLIDMCFSGEFTREEIRNKLVGNGGAVAFFGTNSMQEVEKMAGAGNERARIFLKAYVLNICKYIAAMAATADGKVDAILLTGGIANSKFITDAIAEKVKFIAPVAVYPGEDEIASLAEYGYMILAGKTKIHTYNKERLIE
jgi:butyrate kinase